MGKIRRPPPAGIMRHMLEGSGMWFKRFANFTLAGEGELPKTFLRPGMAAKGTKVFRLPLLLHQRQAKPPTLPLPARFAPGRSAAPATATAGASAATTAVTATTAEAVPATTATRARLARTGLVHGQSPPAQFGAIQRRHRFIRIGIHRHFDKRETASLTCVPVLDNLYSIHLSIC
jgi:hypothetical protein